MTRSRWYSPQLSRQVVAKLYYRAKSERIPMTVLANRLVEQALASNEAIEILPIEECKTDINSK